LPGRGMVWLGGAWCGLVGHGKVRIEILRHDRRISNKGGEKNMTRKMTEIILAEITALIWVAVFILMF
jgi:hypothetical protein